MKRILCLLMFMACAYFSGYLAFREQQQSSAHCDVEVAFQGDSLLYGFYPLISIDQMVTGLCFADGKGHGC